MGEDRIEAFLQAEHFAVVGASDDFSKYGAKVFSCYRQAGRRATPVNPRASSIQGVPAVARLSELPEPATSVSIITPPEVTETIVEEAAESGAKILWMQPGAESRVAIARAHELGLEVIARGPCLLVVLGYRE